MLIREKERRLIEAVELLCDQVRISLPERWSLCLSMDSTEASLNLTDPDGNDVEFDGGEHNYSAITSACDHAREIEAEKR